MRDEDVRGATLKRHGFIFAAGGFHYGGQKGEEAGGARVGEVLSWVPVRRACNESSIEGFTCTVSTGGMLARSGRKALSTPSIETARAMPPESAMPSPYGMGLYTERGR